MAIAFITKETTEDLTGKTHWWGAPDLPKDIPYPYEIIGEGEEGYEEPLTFLCQIRMEDIAALDKENLLPHTGMMYFFAPLDYFLGDLDSDLDYHVKPVVIYSTETEGLEPYDLHWEDTGESVFRPAEEMVFERTEGESGYGNMLLSIPVQDEIRDWNPGCISLMQIDENDRWDLRFYDCGMYYILMPEEALKNREWDKATGDLFSY